MTSATVLRLAWECMRERGKAARQSLLPDEYWRTFHAWATKAIEEARYRPTGLTEIRSSLLDAADVLEKTGRSAWANDNRQQIATFENSPRPWRSLDHTASARPPEAVRDFAFYIRAGGAIRRRVPVRPGGWELPRRGSGCAELRFLPRGRDLHTPGPCKSS